MNLNDNFTDTLNSFEMIKGNLPHMALPELHRIAHEYNNTITKMIHEIEEFMFANALSMEERTMHLCRIEKLDEIILHFAMEIDNRIRLAA